MSHPGFNADPQGDAVDWEPGTADAVAVVRRIAFGTSRMSPSCGASASGG
ncbi:MAG: hypothetical protein H0W42_04015 [Gemmatimonadaceae bacterium]|nr:hypothetical protein [Gemmatimonadaceae bacterium]